MKFNAVSFVLSMIAFYFPGSYEERPPMALFYYPDEDMYMISDTTVLWNREYRTSPYTRVLLLCPTFYEMPDFRDTYFEIKEIYWNNNERQIIATTCCYNGFPQQIDAQLFGPLTVGYYIRNDHETKERLKSAELASTKFPNVETHERSLISKIYTSWLYFSIKELALSRSHHRINVYYNNRNPKTCKGYEFGSEGLYKENIYPFYSEENQEKLREKFLWPKQNELLVKHQFVPIDDFTDEYSREASCAIFNIVPVWRSISEGSMRRVERYIQLVAGMLPINTLSITTIAHENLKLALMTYDQLLTWNDSEHEHSFIEDLQPVYLDVEQNRIPVPEVLIKVVSYRLQFPIPEDDNERKFFTVKDPYKIAIVVHNEIDSQDVKKVCNGSQELCERNGWYVTDDGKDKNVYCCELFDGIFEKYGYLKEGVQNLPFNLYETVLTKKDQQDGHTKFVYNVVNDIILRILLRKSQYENIFIHY